KKNGRIGRSQGCPALPIDLNKPVINLIKNKTVIFAYYNESTYLKSSVYLDFERMIQGLENVLPRTAAAI
ncbi:MAG TPA: murein L,D-transpeptidase catalytic domain family protein, partial [Chryseosolibacter sp.]